VKTKLLITEFVQDKNVGAIASSSKHIVEKLIENINFETANIIIEYGPGDGVITRMILDNMKPDAALYVFESNKTFIDHLSEIKDKRLNIINDDAENAKQILKSKYKIESVDYIVSTIPFTLIEKRKRRRIIFKSHTLLNEKGRFITCQYSWFIFNLIKEKFKTAEWEFVFLNLPPSFIMVGLK
jgi:phospholipid N-methyltransferase